jgi:hypothetical protein
MSNIVSKLNFEHLRNETHGELNENVKGLIVETHKSGLIVTTLLDQYEGEYSEEMTSINVVRKSEVTLEIEEQDQKRDRMFRGLSGMVKSSLNHYLPEKVKAANKVSVLLDKYGNVADKPFDQETMAIENLYQELQSGDYPAALETLQLKDWVEELHIENIKFRDLMKQRYDEVSKRTALKMKETRAKVDATLRKIITQIEAYYIVKEAAGEDMTAFNAFIAKLNAILERYKNILAQQKGRRDADK